MQNLTKIGVLLDAPNDCDNLLGIVYIYNVKRNKFLFGFLLFAVVAVLAGYGYGPTAQKVEELNELQYAEGEFDYYHTKRKYRNRRKGDRPFRKYLKIFLYDHPAVYRDGRYLLDHLEQNALLLVIRDWPNDTLEIGYLETDDAGLRIMYDIKYQGKSLVDVEGIKDSMRTEAMMMLIFSVIGAILSLLSLMMHVRQKKKAKA